jgi:multicomponent Na+:H+ antiporter subunit E
MRRLLVPFGGYALLWALLTGGESRSWLVGLPAAALAAWTSTRLAGDARTPVPLPRAAAFLPFFLDQSLRGAWDVARRALDPRLPVDPGRIRYACRLPAGAPRVLFANVVSLLPGTLFLADHGDAMELHTVDHRRPWDRELGRLEARVAAVFGLPAGERR